MANKPSRPCTRCGATDYHRRPSRVKRNEHICSPCERQLGYKGRWQSRRLAAYRARAERQGVAFDLDASIFDQIPSECPACGRGLERGSEDRATSPSLDRIIPSEGYTFANVAWLCNRCNTFKGESTPAELYAIADWTYEEMRKRGVQAVTRLRPQQEKPE